MTIIQWQESLNTGIDVIDTQHRRIVAMINELHHATLQNDPQAILDVIDELIDYTLSHFSFEEALMEDAGYTFSHAHKRVHDIFVRRVQEFQVRANTGEDVARELNALLSRWLLNHIRNDDANYVASVKASMNALTRDDRENGWLRRSLKRFFR
ncbi:bacteriohemerythrin [Lysobacter sp.]|uniref:bacteriohemerythrin n=1 Tax=Lysobacter sp. TaxID=72226 RepID=UPI002D630D15|nr:bacteriohemerythrin [Lysobacter sp.]HZX78229.1 bacteriohemerythrin [Lysobacter sp.]